MNNIKSIRISVEEAEEMRKMHLRRDSAFNCMNSSYGKEKEKYRKEVDFCTNWIHKKLELYKLLYAPEEYQQLQSPRCPWVNYFDYSINFSLDQHVQ